YTVNVTLKDSDNVSAITTIAQAVNNLAPTASAGGNRSAAANNPITLYGSESHPGRSDTFTFFWHLVTSSNGQPVSDAVTQNLAFTPTSTGSYTFTLTATDSDSAASSPSTAVVIVQN